MIDFLQIEKEKKVRISIINNARSAKEKICVFFLILIFAIISFHSAVGGWRRPPSKLLGEGGCHTSNCGSETVHSNLYYP